MKVYCKNCKHTDGYYHNECNRLNINKRIIPYRDLKYKNISQDQKENIKGECKYYKRKWYKFWIDNNKDKI